MNDADEIAPPRRLRQRRPLPEPLIYRERDLDAVTRMSRKAREDAIAAGIFPKPIMLSTKAKGWLVSEINDWLEGLRSQRDAA
jgi:predicted DNA-binding transcriptional regulator AlpA